MTATIEPQDPTTRFTNRVENYVKYRPAYPESLREALVREVGLSAASVVADVGSGTGLSTDLLRRIGCDVYAVEPNAAMRAAAEARFAHDPRVHNIPGRAEATTLGDASVEAVTAGTAFHWFDRAGARREFARILRPVGQVALFWNVRRTDGTPFHRDYEQLLRNYGTDYTADSRREMDHEALLAFYGGAYDARTFATAQHLDFDGLRGRLLSSSYAPGPDRPKHEAMIDELRRLFDQHQQNGCVELLYDTQLYFGQLRAAGGKL